MADQRRDDEDDLCPQTEAPQQSNLEPVMEELRMLQQAGWTWSETTPNVIVHPHDSQVFARYDPCSGELLFSPKIVEMLRKMLREEQASE
jgi:hypothetical protein